MLHAPRQTGSGAKTADEIRLAALDDACDPAMSELLEFWRNLVNNGEPPVREELNPISLRPWLGHISIYEATKGEDFIIRLEGSAIVTLTGEDWTKHMASDVDRKYGSRLVEHMSEVMEKKEPAFHRMMLFQRRHFLASRLLLPIRKSANGPVNQVFLVLYKDLHQPKS